jgi:hypothetical protein
MFVLACFIGIYSYGIFALGILDLLTRPNITAFTFSWLVIFITYHLSPLLNLRGGRGSSKIIADLKLNVFTWLLLSLLITQSLVNLLGALGPELGFDALWYHLTQPKIWLQETAIRFIPGPIFRYSVTPQLTETLYTAALAFSNEIAAKLIHYSFGILCLIITFKLARKFLTPDSSLLATLLLSSNLVFSWQSTTAYVDLTRTFFESLALLLFLEDKYTASAITLGLAICSKLISLVSLPIFLFLMIIKKIGWLRTMNYLLITVFIPLPWFLFAYLHTGNPIYPIGSLDLAMPISWNPTDLWTLFTRSADPISPIYIITAPLLFFINLKNWSRGEQLITAYVLLAQFFWFIFPHTGGSRYYLPYLPALSVLTIIIFLKLQDEIIKKFLIFLTLTLTLTTVVYRLAANSQYLPVIFGRQTTGDFLSRNLNFNFGDFYDTDGYLANHLSAQTKISPLGINNLYYINYQLVLPPQPVTAADYLLIRSPDSQFIPDTSWHQVHQNNQTKTSLYVRN